ncbi:MAG: glycine--tRNA ligase subunit alpha, partial [Gammaproteobacteria bacterium]|nr:glycine--tRNA ligase subunit alpha [Gammaproteobacteria bacterium]
VRWLSQGVAEAFHAQRGKPGFPGLREAPASAA